LERKTPAQIYAHTDVSFINKSTSRAAQAGCWYVRFEKDPSTEVSFTCSGGIHTLAIVHSFNRTSLRCEEGAIHIAFAFSGVLRKNHVVYVCLPGFSAVRKKVKNGDINTMGHTSHASLGPSYGLSGINEWNSSESRGAAQKGIEKHSSSGSETVDVVSAPPSKASVDSGLEEFAQRIKKLGEFLEEDATMFHAESESVRDTPMLPQQGNNSMKNRKAAHAGPVRLQNEIQVSSACMYVCMYV
jgi:hypothetical protein